MENLKSEKVLTAKELASYFDHTLLRANATVSEFKKLCDDSKRYGFCMVAINPAPVKLCKTFLAGSQVHVGAAIAFPLGQTTLEDKLSETRNAIKNGADEIDYVVNLTKLKAGDTAYIESEMARITDICREFSVVSKVIFENCYLTEDEKKTLCHIAAKVKPDFIKTSTGFGTGGATLEDVALMKKETEGSGVSRRNSYLKDSIRNDRSWSKQNRIYFKCCHYGRIYGSFAIIIKYIKNSIQRRILV